MNLAAHSGGIFVTGAAGFIGSRLCQFLEGRGTIQSFPVDVRYVEEVRECIHLQPRTVIHLASKGTVTTPLSQAPTLLDTTIDGTFNVLSVLNPQLVILPSSCAVYGNTGPQPAEPMRTKVSPLSIYGLSKVLAEQILTMWVRDTGNTAMILRVGNVVGRGCGGLIPYLVRHAVRNQDPVVPARMRGAGRIVRDYVPVDYVSHAMLAAAEQRLPSGTALTLNVGSGEGMANHRVAEIVRSVLGLRGYVLTIEWESEPAYGEALIALLDVKQTEERFGLQRPSRTSVHRVIEEAALHCLETCTRREESERAITTYPLPASPG